MLMSALKLDSPRLGSVLPHLVSYLQDLSAPTARASVVWMIGHYQQEAMKAYFVMVYDML